MAESSTQFGCNDLAKNVSGCEENGNIRLINPNAQIDEEGVKNEDLVMYATLRARVKNKSLLVDKDDELWNELTFIKAKSNAPGQAAEGSVNATPENTSFLTTNWTNIGSSDMLFETDHETFGITNINIDIQADFIPKISIDFVDLRGATLFEQGSCSPYASFFHQPYPVFELVLKGYYGSPIKYQLMVKDFRTTFDASTGNYVSKAEMVGFNYAFLSDILLAYVLAVPYIEGADEILVSIYEDYLKYYDERGFNQGKNKFEPLSADDNSPLTLYNYVRKLQELEGQGNSDKGAIAEIQNSSELFTIENLDKFQEILNDIDEFIDKDFDEAWKKEGGKNINNLYYYGNSSGGNTGVNTEKLLDVYNSFFGSAGKITTLISVYNDLVDDSGSISLTTISANPKIERGSTYLLSLDLDGIIKDMDNKLNEISLDLKLKRKEFIELANAKIKSSVGFVPTIRSFFTTLIGNTELFLELLRNASYDAEEYHQRNSDSDKIRFKNEEDVPVSDIVYAWPTYTEIRQSGTRDETEVEVYPGTNPKFQNWPEVIFVEKLLKALTEMNRKLEEGEGEEFNPEVDPYDGIPGRDNYFPVNAMETPLGARDANNSYYNLNSKDAVIRSLGERFILYSNVTGVNSNFLNTSIIASAKNGFNETLLERGKYAIQPVEFNLNKPFDPLKKYQVFPGIEKLNNGILTPYFSAGHYFNPTKWGGEDQNSGVNLTYSSGYKKIGGIKGYPYIDDRKFLGNPKPMGLPRENSDYANTKETDFNIVDLMEGDGEVKSSNNLTYEQLTSASELRTHLISFKIPKTDGDADETKFNESFKYEGNLGNKKSFTSDENIVVLEPLYYTKKMIILFVDKDTTKPGYNVENHLSQIPQNIRDKSWIIICTNYIGNDYTGKNKSARAEFLVNYGGGFNTYLQLINKTVQILYEAKGNPTRKVDSSEVNVSSGIEQNFDITLLGYGAGSFESFAYRESIGYSYPNWTLLDGIEMIGLVDPNLFGISGTSYTDVTGDGVVFNDFGSPTLFPTITLELAKEWFGFSSKGVRMVWGSDTQVNVFGGSDTPNEYKKLENYIKQSTANSGVNGKSIKISGLNKSQALKSWFENYGEELVSDVLETDFLIFPSVNQISQIETTSENNDLTPKKQLEWVGTLLSQRQSENWEYLGRLEAHNVFNSLTNQNLIGNILSSLDNVKELHTKILSTLGISASDTYSDDTLHELYRYDKPITINRVSKEKGGPIKVLPNIHNMKGSDLVRLTRFDNIEDQGWGFSNSTNKSESPVYFWYKNASGRNGFAIDPESTFITSGVFEQLNKFYGSEPKGENKLNVSESSTEYVDAVLARDFDLKNGTQTLMHRYDKGMARTGLFNTEGTFLTNSTRASIDGSVDQLGNAMSNVFSQTNRVIQDKFLSFDSWPNQVFAYTSFTNLGSSRFQKIGGEYTRKYIKEPILLGLTTNEDTLKYPQNIRHNSSGLDQTGTMNQTWNTFNFNTPIYKSYSLESAELRDDLGEDEKATPAWKNYRASIISYSNWASNFLSDTKDLKSSANTKGDSNQLKVSSGFGLNGSLSAFFDKESDEIKLENTNFFNQTNTITETPWWRHNFPSNQSNSKTSKRYYSFFGAGVFNEIEGDKFSNNASENGKYIRKSSTQNNYPKDTELGKQATFISKAPLFVGLGNDLDSYNDSSKFFPAGNGAKFNYFSEFTPQDNQIYIGNGFNSSLNLSTASQDNYYGSSVDWSVKLNNKNQFQGRKYQLTNHNKEEFSVTRDSDSGTVGSDGTIDLGNITVDPNLTSYNKTKAWKGSLAYLFLSNQYHKPWTGMYTNTNKNLGPQGYFGLSSFNAQMPRHSVLMLGAVLWRMRESGLLESDDNKWNLSSEITNGLDPVNYPIVPNKPQLPFNKTSAKTFNFKHFTLGSEPIQDVDTQLNPLGSVWPTNHNVRPPLVSLLANRNGGDTTGYGMGGAKLMTFPRADEWPVPNLGMIGAYDFFADKKAKNPFKNQYRIFTPILANSSMNALRYNTQDVRFRNTNEQLERFKTQLEAALGDGVAKIQEKVAEAQENEVQNAQVDGQTDAAAEAAGQAQAKKAQELITELQTKAKEKLEESQVVTIDALLEKLKALSGSEESFTRITSLIYEGRELLKGAFLNTETTDAIKAKIGVYPNDDYSNLNEAILPPGMGIDFFNVNDEAKRHMLDKVADGRSCLWKQIGADRIASDGTVEEMNKSGSEPSMYNLVTDESGQITGAEVSGTLYKTAIADSEFFRTIVENGVIRKVDPTNGDIFTVSINEVVKEVNEEVDVTYRVYKGQAEYDLYTNKTGEPLKSGTSDTPFKLSVDILDNSGDVKWAAGTKYKEWTAKRGHLNITPNSDGKWNLITPMILEENGYTPTSGYKKLTSKFDLNRYRSKEAQQMVVNSARRDYAGNTYIGDRSIEAQVKISEDIPGLFSTSPTTSGPKPNDGFYYRYEGSYKVFSDGSYVVYRKGYYRYPSETTVDDFRFVGVEAKKPRRVLVDLKDLSPKDAIRLGLKSETSSNNEFNTDILNLVKSEYTLLNDPEVDQDSYNSSVTKRLQRRSSYKGYLRGYLPMGPEIWFMPTEVKKIFIKEFEDYVGDMNDWVEPGGSTDNFDYVLQTIDPLNFPTYKNDNKFGVFKNEIIYPTAFEEIGTVGTDAPSVLRLSTNATRNAYGDGIDLDSNKMPEIPQPLLDFFNLFDINEAITPIRAIRPIYKSPGNSSDFFLDTESTLFPKLYKYIEQKTKINISADGGQAIGNEKLLNVYKSLFGSYYFVTSTTPRTFWGEFPLQEIDGEMVETTHDYFTFNKREMFAFLKGFIQELSSPEIKGAFEKGLKDSYLDELNGEVLGAGQDDDIRLSIYRSLKTLYDKYISGSAAGKTNGQGEDKTRMFYNPIGKNRLFIDHFVFLNRVNADIGDAALVKLETVNNLFQNTQNSIFEITSDVLTSSNFLFLPLPGYVDLSAGLTKEAVDRNTEYPNFAAEQANNMFRPISDQGTFSDIDSKLGSPMWYSMYIGGVSRQLKLKNDDNQPGCLTELNINGKKEQSDDGFLLSPSPSSKPAPPDFTSTSTPDNSLTNSNSTSKGITAFKVRFGAQNQSHFTGINLDQLEFQDTNESIVATANIAKRAADGGAGGFIAKGQDLYQIFLNRSYTAKVESMGNAMIQPFQYFQLENVPMFFGSYLITKVSHNVRPNHMKTSFEGVRMSHATVPVVEDFISTFNIKPSKEGAKRKSLKGTGGNSNKASGGGSSSSSSSTTGAKSVSGLYYPIEIATTNVTDANGNTKNITKKIREGLVARGFNLKQILTSNSKYKGRALKDGTFYNETQTVNAPAKGNPVQYPKYSGTDERGPKGIQIHWTAGYTTKSAIDTLGSKGLAYSILIGEDGPAYQISNLERSTYHAGCTSGCPRCKGGMNQKALGISYVGGIEAGSKVSANAGYLRTWEDWQTEEKIVPWCPNGTIWNSEGITSCSDKEVTSGKHKPSAKGKVFRPKDQWESLVDSILMMKVKYPRMQWLTGHNFTCSGKSDPGLGFPWDKLIRDLKARGWNETDADDDPFVVTEWPNDNPGGPKSKGDTSKGIVETQKERFDEVIAEFETAGIENGAEANEYDMDDVLITQQESANDAEAGQTVDELGCRILNGPFKYGPNNTGKGLIEDLGLTKEQAAGVVGNLRAESGLVPDRIQGSGTKTGLITEAKNKNNESLGYGWAQWTFPSLKTDFEESAKSVGVDLTKTPADIDVSYKYLVEFINESGNLAIDKAKYGNIATELGIDKCGGLEGLKKTKTVRESSVYFLGCYERSAVQDEKEIQKRTNFANEVYQTCESSNSTTQNDDTETVVENGVIVHSNVKNLKEALGIEGPYTVNYPPPAGEIPQSTIDKLVLLNVEYIDYAGKECRGQIVTFKSGEEAMKKVFKKLKTIGYPIEKCDLPVKYNWNDADLMSKNITNSFNYRAITGGNNISPHGTRTVLDLNPLWNPFFEPAYQNDIKSNGVSPGPYEELTPTETPYQTVESYWKNNPNYSKTVKAVGFWSQDEAKKMNIVDKSWMPNNEEITTTGDNAAGKKSKIVQAFKESGFNVWGGAWTTIIDGQHFEIVSSSSNGVNI
jgi:N-acetyl-anhydromuramyl-L-alanine amidase AmpD